MYHDKKNSGGTVAYNFEGKSKEDNTSVLLRATLGIKLKNTGLNKVRDGMKIGGFHWGWKLGDWG